MKPASATSFGAVAVNRLRQRLLERRARGVGAMIHDLGVQAGRARRFQAGGVGVVADDGADVYGQPAGAHLVDDGLQVGAASRNQDNDRESGCALRQGERSEGA